MLKLHSGPFHPILEDAFAAVVAELKKEPFAALAIVAPSGGLRRRAEAILAERNVAALNLHFSTIGAFADEIVAAAGGLPKRPGKKAPPAIVSDPVFFDTLVKQILKKDKPFPGMADLAVPDGFPPSVRSTLRDLIDAGVEPEKLLDAVNEREQFNIPEVDAGSLKQLINLYRLYLERMDALGVASRSHVLEAAAGYAPLSTHLAGFKAVLFYGFYDMTGLQVGLLDAVARHHETHFFFPYLHRHPDHGFGARFRGDVLDKIPHEEVVLAEAAEPPVAFRGAARVETGAGLLPRILKWDDAEARVINVSGLRDEAWTVAAEILRLHEAGVPYSEIAVVARTRERLAQFPAVFDERQIPYSTSWKRTMAEMPQVNVGLELLARLAGVGISLAFAKSADVRFDAAAPVEPWPASAPWNETAERAAAAIAAHVSPGTAESKAAWEALTQAVLSLREFDRLGPSVGRDEFLDTLRDKWSRLPLPADSDAVGVAVLHAEAARGLPFDTVFVAGLEERAFPRVIREDPFLRDKTRFAIFDTIGNKISEKMLALAEERLLLHLLLNSARRRIALTYQRSDDEGKIVGASSFLRRLVNEWGLEFEAAVNVVPRRLGAKLAAAPAEVLGPRDLVSSLLMDGRAADAVKLASAVGRDGASLARSAKALESLESWENAGVFDGLVGKGVGEAHLKAAGMSPSGLESFGRCPFQYFVRRVLRLQPPEEALAPDQIANDVRGKMVHGFLETFYRRCLAEFGKTWPAVPPEKLYDEVFDEVFSARPPEIYPLLWTALKRALKTQIFSLVSADFSTLSARGLAPRFFEQKHESSDLEEKLGGVRFVGQMDRIDVGEGRARVIDYKTGREKYGKVATAVVRGDKVQPSVYLLMAAEFLKEQGLDLKEIDFAYLHLREDQPPSELDAASWEAIRADALDTLAQELAMIREGRFPLRRDRHCDVCDVATICRQTDSLSVYRSEREGDLLKALKKKKAKGAA